MPCDVPPIALACSWESFASVARSKDMYRRDMVMKSFSKRENLLRPAFTLIDVLVSIAVVSILIAVMLPGLSGVRETARKVACGSNLRQLGLVTALYANDNRDLLPPSIMTLDNMDIAALPMPVSPALVRFDTELRLPESISDNDGWDGWGALVRDGQLSAYDVLYCPSHGDGVSVESFAEAYRAQASTIVANYGYRGQGPRGERRLSSLPGPSVLGSDTFGELGWLNHENGLNTLTATLSVAWTPDAALSVPLYTVAAQTSSSTRDDHGDGNEAQRNHLDQIWRDLDHPSPAGTGRSGN